VNPAGIAVNTSTLMGNNMTLYEEAKNFHKYMIPKVNPLSPSPTSLEYERYTEKRLARAEYIARALGELVLKGDTPAWMEEEVYYLLDELNDK
jgi:hypothetical protein